MNLFFGSHYCHIYYRVLFFRSITTILTITLEKETQISRFQFKKLTFCSLDVLETFLYKTSYMSSKIF